MKPIKIFVSTGLAILCLISCKNDSKPVPSAAEATQPTPPPSPKPEVYLYMVNVDKLLLREQPSKSSKAITKFPEGDFVEGAGEISTNKEEVTLRGIPYKEPYFKVSSTTPEQLSGWAFSAALLPVYAGSRTTLPDLGKLSAFSNFLQTLDVHKLDSGKKAWDYTSANLSGVQGTLADACFILLEQFLFRMETSGDLYQVIEKIEWQEADYQAVEKETFNMKQYPATQALALNGFRLEQGEGTIFPVTEWAKFGDFFGTKVTPAMKNYIEQSIAEQKNLISDDGGIVITLESVADRAAWWEKFNQANPYFVRSEETQNNQHGLIFTLICGANNTPVFTGEPEAVSADFQKAWVYVQQKYAGTELGRAVKEMADLVAAEGGKRSKKVDTLMQRFMAE